MLKICLSPAIYRSVTPQTHSNLLYEVALYFNTPQLREQVELEYAPFGNDAMIDRSRSLSASVFLQHPKHLDVLVWVDADMHWQPGDIFRIASKAHERQAIVGGIVSKRGFGLGIACRMKCGARPVQTGTDELVPCSYVGAAFMAIPRAALEKIALTLPTCNMGPQQFKPFCLPTLAPNDQVDGLLDYLSEDWALCRRALDCGVEIFVDLKPIITHVGEHEYSIDDAFATYTDSVYVLHGEQNVANAHMLAEKLRGYGITRVDVLTGNVTAALLADEDRWRERTILINGDATWTDSQLYNVLSKGKFGFFGYALDDVNPEFFGGGIGRDTWRLKGTLAHARSYLDTRPKLTISETIGVWYRAACGFPLDGNKIDRRVSFWAELGRDASTTRPQQQLREAA